MKHIYYFVLLLFPSILMAQGVKISATPGNPDPSSILQLESTTQGFLLPKMTTTQRNAIVNPAVGLQVFNTTTECVEVYFSTGWKAIKCKCATYPSALFLNAPNPVAVSAPTLFTPDTLGLSYSWTFPGGNPASSAAQSPSVTWSQSGTYSVQLIVTDADGCSDTNVQQVSVINCVLGGTATFSPCGQTGNTGPSQNQCNLTYGPGVVTVVNGIQEWTVPQGLCSVNIECWGAQGGGASTGGYGAYTKGTFTVNGGEVLRILVGQRGLNAANTDAGSGGGGSFVTRSNNTLMIAAGGGGGGTRSTNAALVDATSGINGNNDSGPSAQNAGGTAGSGGVAGGSWGGGGGGGFASVGGNGQSSGNSMPASGGSNWTGNMVGGVYTGFSYSYGSNGGFGGGGAASWAAGGGGGYSGGAGKYSAGSGTERPAAGGGGSYNSGTNQTNQSGVRQGNGQVTITW